jgi:ABC-type branched-subunit amino acid transport system ATPase component
MLFFPAGAVGAVQRIFRRRLRRQQGARHRRRHRDAAPTDASTDAGLPSITATATVGRTRPPTGDICRGHGMPSMHSAITRSQVRRRAPILELQDITKSYAGVTAVNAVSLKVMPGTVHAVIGPNGAGKSTLINVISGLYQPDSGSIRFLGRDITRLAPHRRAVLGLTRTFQNLQLIGTLTVAENVMLGLQRGSGFVPEAGCAGWSRDTEERGERAEALRLLRFFGIERLADSPAGRPAVRPPQAVRTGPRARATAHDAVPGRADRRPQRRRSAGDHGEDPRAEGTGHDGAAGRTQHELRHGTVRHGHRARLRPRRSARAPPDIVQRDPAVIAAYLGTGEA